ncbi:SRPBCC domain-containing protein [Nesterenkonia lutea]|uniref:Uncharacterized protein YndB with AHSA1/START domain n=1 Tax=Nesterenkonia lutea TaxID=272919 RepID=A0ABR9JDH5_9MICC|nr:SRPBCC domain-containing protein [Nesterenkonia lutea]MBE1523984.1 uncharacterized protein YndB with AHSA1/START domain [Nesterenkonia lutea]
MSPVTIVHDTVQVSRSIRIPLDKAWAAYQDTARRAEWGVPAGEQMVYSRDQLTRGGLTEYRCGTPGELQYHVRGEYLVVEPESLVVHTETVTTGDELLSSSLVTWEFRENLDGSLVSITNQVTSFVGQEMIDGTRNGHSIALNQLATLLEN